MLRTASRTFVATLALAVMLGMADTASAQKTKSKASVRGSRSAPKVQPAPRVQRSAPRVQRVAPPSQRANVGSIKAYPQGRSARSLPQSIRSRETVRVNRVPAPSQRNSSAGALKAYRQDRSEKPAPQTIRSSETLRINKVAPPSQRSASSSSIKSAFRDGDAARTGGGGRSVIRDRVKDAFRNAPERSTRRYVDDGRVRYNPRPYYRSGYRDGYRYGYHSGFHYGYHHGYHYGHHYLHNHYYGPHLVFGFHYGGFGFYHSHWHFAIVIGEPVLVPYYYRHYRYSWWDGRSASLVTWDRAMETRSGDYRFVAGTCVELWLQTRDGTDYTIKADPRQWDAQDPGELYAALWGELEREGQLHIEDVNGALHVFPAGMIQQIEARACR